MKRNALFVALCLAFVAVIAVTWARNQWGIPVGDEQAYGQWLYLWRLEGPLASLAAGRPVGYLAPTAAVSWVAGPLPAGRWISTVSIACLGWSVWWLSTRLGAGWLGRRLAILAFLNMVLAGHTFVFNAIADPLFTLIMFWVIAGAGVAVVERRMGLAAVAGAGLAFAWMVRPLAPVYTIAIVSALGVVVLRDTSRGRALRYAAAFCLVAACGVLLEQTPALRATGHLAFENKSSNSDMDRKARLLSILRHSEQPGAGLKGWMWVPLASRQDAAQYEAQHGAGSLAVTRAGSWRAAPLDKLYQFLISISARTIFYFASLVGLLLPLAWLVRPSREPDPARAHYLAFGGTVAVVYVVLINIIASPFIEWRWFLLPASGAMCLGAIALERMLETRRPMGIALLAVQLLFLCASWAIWAHRVAIGYPPRGSF